MRWLTAVGVLLYLARSSDAAVLKCSPESRDPLCASEKRDISPPPSPPDAECLAGSEWESNCHSCRCSNSGIAECVKQDSCELQVFKEPIKCKPSTSFQKDCNTCTCLENGLGLCTLKGCGFPIYTDRRKRQAPNGQNKCKPGSSWKESCNSCWCTDAGVSVCTKIGCVGNIFKRQAADGQNKCKPGTSWKESCNSCQCTETGDSVCTKIECVGYIAKREAPKQDMDCVPGSSWKMSCNSCWCSDNGTPLCTNKGCAVEKREAPKQEMECVPGTSWKMSCNSCWCSDNGTPLCTKKGCVVERLREREEREKRDTSKLNATLIRKTRAVQEAAKACQPGSEFRMDCNKCLCNDEGQDFSCTRIDCAAQNGNGGADGARSKRELSETVSMQCVAGSVFDRECNVCRCTADGMHSVCTIKRCKQPVEPETTESAPAFRCTPGDQFKQDCKDCTCSADGKNVFCTLRICDQVLGDIKVDQ